jgi:hypothetical protein
MTTATAIIIALLALFVGVALPLIIQMFVTTRAIHSSTERMERRLDATLSEISGAIAQFRSPRASADGAAVLGAALVPAIVAAVRTFRSHHTTGDTNGSPSPQASPNA